MFCAWHSSFSVFIMADIHKKGRGAEKDRKGKGCEGGNLYHVLPQVCRMLVIAIMLLCFVMGGATEVIGDLQFLCLLQCCFPW